MNTFMPRNEKWERYSYKRSYEALEKNAISETEQQ